MICKYCAHWEPDIDPETGVEIQVWAKNRLGGNQT